MIFALITLPVMLLAIAIAVVPVLHVMLQDERKRRGADNVSVALAKQVETEKAEEFDSALAA